MSGRRSSSSGNSQTTCTRKRLLIYGTASVFAVLFFVRLLSNSSQQAQILEERVKSSVGELDPIIIQNDEFKCPASSGFFAVSPNACVISYYACVGGEHFLQDCPGNGNIFDPVGLICVSVDRASCKPGN